jgi:DNA-binding response OmpR family regulator
MIEQAESLNNQALVSEVSALGRLLVIEDDPSICMLIEKLGEKAGFIATTANSFDDAVRHLGPTNSTASRSIYLSVRKPELRSFSVLRTWDPERR